jgi:hypothetical protein
MNIYLFIFLDDSSTQQTRGVAQKILADCYINADIHSGDQLQNLNTTG